MQKEKRNNKRQSFLGIVSSFLLFFGSIIIVINLVDNQSKKIIEKKAMDDFFKVQNQVNQLEDIEENIEQEEEISNNKTYSYMAVIEIPKIKLKQGFFDKKSYYNHVDRNIKILNESDLPNKKFGNVILVGHSGIGQVAYFKKIHSLALEDEIIIYYRKLKYIYKVLDIYDIDKTGYIKLKDWVDKSTLTLITCHSNKDKQIVVVSELVDIKK